ncbi:MAG: ISAzo13 family transposase [Magnetococcales bacterium]|nr:ISAzo13 family transposase [Magnetococcales bacterium]
MTGDTDHVIREKYESLKTVLDERTRRLWAAAEANALGRGGISCISRATGVSRTTVHQGIRELAAAKSGKGAKALSKRVRSPGGGRKRVTENDPTLLADLERLVDPMSRGDPESPLRWTCKSVRQLTSALGNQGHVIGRQKVADLLEVLGYSLQANQKKREGSRHPDRDAQFEHINNQVMDFQRRRQPVISIDTKKKELVGDFKNGGREWNPKGKPEPVRVHDFADKELGKVNPYGVYDQTANVGWVSVGTDHDTAEFAVESIRRWWYKMGAKMYPTATEMLITADCGGSNGYRVRLWKVALQNLANETGLRIHVCHFPPGTSKWNKIEHRMFCHITMNWRGKPLTSHEVIVNLLGNTTTKGELTIKAELDTDSYPKGVKVSDEEMKAVNLTKDAFHGEWNYFIDINYSS